MSVLVDTSIAIDALRNFPKATRYLEQLAEQDDGIRASILTRAEIRVGSRGAIQEVDRLVAIVTWEPVTPEIADRAGSFARGHDNDFPGIGLIDYLIAATADVLGLDLATRNVRHFPMFPGLRAPY